jgi:ABC-type Mn2+/Zn2+ transport system ATPase subunit
MLDARNLTKYYGALPALRHASFTARPGQILRYLGPNGSGKSTTARMLVGLVTPTSGDVLWNGHSIFGDLPGFRRQLGYVPEELTSTHTSRRLSTCGSSAGSATSRNRVSRRRSIGCWSCWGSPTTATPRSPRSPKAGARRC